VAVAAAVVVAAVVVAAVVVAVADAEDKQIIQ